MARDSSKTRGTTDGEPGLSAIEAPAHGKPDALQASVLEILRRAVVRGELFPGEKLAEARIASQLGVSRTPVREAFKQLQAEGLVTVVNRSGTFVTDLSSREVAELYEVREALEGMVARLAAEHHDDRDRRALEANVERMRKAVESGDVQEFLVCDREFHRALVIATNNEKLAEHVAFLENRIQRERLGFVVTARPGRAKRSYTEHMRVMTPVLARNADGAERAMRRHVRNGRDEIVSSLEEYERTRHFSRGPRRSPDALVGSSA
jgi:DNA-binding GntR family transcriptional regulator